NPSPLKTAELIQADMAQVGVKVVIVPVEGRFQEARLMDMNHDQEAGEHREITAEETAEMLKNSHSVIITPGYGMAVAQAQYPV
ncbi:NAD(P)(+) transhydrogenase (Re/Si-specific) subunit beta, partial [Salmonella enterica subsp. enterica serovar Montevideo]|nr:NAD(P)(+) transhydrogenase (Re/Si-specific) subunit beta [Salmonella enterica subsp. enterica serovar Montevideo]